MLTASGDNTARIWDAESGEELVTLSGHTGDGELGGLQPGRSALCSPPVRTTRRASGMPRAARNVVTLSGHTDDVNSAVYSPDGRSVLTASDDNTARIWDAESGQELVTLSGHTERVNSAVYSPDGSSCADRQC